MGCRQRGDAHRGQFAICGSSVAGSHQWVVVQRHNDGRISACAQQTFVVDGIRTVSHSAVCNQLVWRFTYSARGVNMSHRGSNEVQHVYRVRNFVWHEREKCVACCRTVCHLQSHMHIMLRDRLACSQKAMEHSPAVPASTAGA